MRALSSRFISLPAWSLVLVTAALSLSGCKGNLPDYARPTRGDTDVEGLEGRDLIAYRTISKDDFKAAGPRPDDAQYAERMGAVTCAHLFNHPTPSYAIEQTESGYVGYYENMSFVARMDRDCSWWNPKKSQVPEEYILQHEQIHFALAESAARRLDAEAQEVVAKFRPSGSTSHAVEERLQGIIHEIFDKAINKLLKRNLSFDQDTSNTYAPEKQQEWFEQVMSELK